MSNIFAYIYRTLKVIERYPAQGGKAVSIEITRKYRVCADAERLRSQVIAERAFLARRVIQEFSRENSG